MWSRKHLLGLEELTVEEIVTILDTATLFKEVADRRVEKVDALRGKTVVLLFFEPSTRTTISFSVAARRLSADVISVGKTVSSATKGETLRDTARTIEAMGIDVVVVRHSVPGAPHMLARSLDVGVVNAGDGAHEHPTQALLDIYTIRDRKGKVEGLNVAIVGDIAHSRVARSNIHGLTKLGANVFVVGPATMMPPHIEKMGVTVCYDIDEILGELDVINMLRIQQERLRGPLLPSLRGYTRLFGLTRERERRLRDDALVMHPGPMNRGVEIAPEVADGPRSVVLEQVTNGVAVRMAVLYLLTGGRELQGMLQQGGTGLNVPKLSEKKISIGDRQFEATTKSMKDIQGLVAQLLLHMSNVGLFDESSKAVLHDIQARTMILTDSQRVTQEAVAELQERMKRFADLMAELPKSKRNHLAEWLGNLPSSVSAAAFIEGIKWVIS